MITENQAPPDVVSPPWRWLILLGTLVLVIVLFIWLRPPADAYTKAVLSLQGDAVNGRSIFVMNCVPCHGQWADGKVGPSLHGVARHKSPAQLVHQIVSGETPPMPKFQADPQKMADLLEYLNKL
jgi:mono/diheme cytochrome c family protein